MAMLFEDNYFKCQNCGSISFNESYIVIYKKEKGRIKNEIYKTTTKKIKCTSCQTLQDEFYTNEFFKDSTIKEVDNNG